MLSFFRLLLEHLRKPGSFFPLHRQVSSASVYSNRGEKNTGKMLENIIVKQQTLTGGLRGGKCLHHFVFNGLDLIVKYCLRKEPIYRGRQKGHRAGASEDGISMSLEFLSSAEPLQSPLPSCLSNPPWDPSCKQG